MFFLFVDLGSEPGEVHFIGSYCRLGPVRPAGSSSISATGEGRGSEDWVGHGVGEIGLVEELGPGWAGSSHMDYI